jgi:hypothetical protein
MTRTAAFGFNRHVFEHKRAGFLSVALETYLVLRRGGPHLPGQKTAMLVVAITALDQPLFDAVAEWPVEILLDVGMAAVTELRLFIDQQELLLFRVMG